VVVVVGGLSYFDRSAEARKLSQRAGRGEAHGVCDGRWREREGSEACSLSLATCGMKLFREGGTRS
jgi:hypothetical protein